MRMFIYTLLSFIAATILFIVVGYALAIISYGVSATGVSPPSLGVALVMVLSAALLFMIAVVVAPYVWMRKR